MKKVVKFGGSSLASAEQFKKVGAIISADESRVICTGEEISGRYEGNRYASPCV